jgi:carboxypeptidase Q
MRLVPTAGLVAATTLISALALAAAPGPEPLPAPVMAMQRAAAKDQRAYAALKSLTTEVGHRFAGSAGDAKAVAWALRTLREQGFANVRAEPVTVPRWIRGKAQVAIVAPEATELAALALGGSVGTPAGGIEAEAIAVTTVDELKALPRASVTGKIVFLYDRMLPTRDGMDYGSTVQIRSRGAIEGAKLGALAVVIRAVGTEDEARPHTGSMRYANGVPRIPAFAIGTRDAQRLIGLFGRGPVRLRLSSDARCDGSAESANVIGEIVGREKPDEFVLLGAHLDSWDVGTGAQDDGAGVVTVMEAARRVGELAQKPRRSLRVVLFANEEFGLSGAKAYALAHEADFAQHVAGFEADLGADRVFQFESKVKADDLAGAIRLADGLAPLGIGFAGNAASGGADTSPMRDRGMPVFDLQHDATRYFEIHHTAADTFDRVDPKALAHNVAAYATLAWMLAEREQRFAPLTRRWPEPVSDVSPCDWQP